MLVLTVTGDMNKSWVAQESMRCYTLHISAGALTVEHGIHAKARVIGACSISWPEILIPVIPVRSETWAGVTDGTWPVLSPKAEQTRLIFYFVFQYLAVQIRGASLQDQCLSQNYRNCLPRFDAPQSGKGIKTLSR